MSVLCPRYRKQEKVPSTDIPIDWNDYKLFAQQRVFMKPLTFLDLCGAPLGGFSQSSIDSIEEGISSGNDLEALFMDVDIDTKKVTSHEGRHRAFWAWKKGIRCVPVILYHNQRNPEGFLRFTDAEKPIRPLQLRTEATTEKSAGWYARKNIIWKG